MLIKNILEKFFEQNPQTQDITEMQVTKIQSVIRQIAEFCTAEIAREAETLSVADIYDAQAKFLKKAKPVQQTANMSEARKGRRPFAKEKYKNYVLYSSLDEIPAGIDTNRILCVYTNKNGKRVGQRYGVLDTSIPAMQARNHIRSAYAVKMNENFLNVSSKMVFSNRKDRTLKKDRKVYPVR